MRFIYLFIFITISFSLFAQNELNTNLDTLEENSNILEQLDSINETWYAKSYLS